MEFHTFLIFHPWICGTVWYGGEIQCKTEKRNAHTDNNVHLGLDPHFLAEKCVGTFFRACFTCGTFEFQREKRQHKIMLWSTSRLIRRSVGPTTHNNMYEFPFCADLSHSNLMELIFRRRYGMLDAFLFSSPSRLANGAARCGYMRFTYKNNRFRWWKSHYRLGIYVSPKLTSAQHAAERRSVTDGKWTDKEKTHSGGEPERKKNFNY